MNIFIKHAFYNATHKNDFGKKFCPLARNTVILVMLLAFGSSINAQTMYGTTGLLHAPTADMQCDKTFMVGGNVLHLTPLHYFNSNEVKYTFNDYLNITIFPWLEVGYTCTINYAEYGSTYFPESVWANILIKTVHSMAVYGCGKKVSGSHGHLRLYLVRTPRVRMKTLEEAV